MSRARGGRRVRLLPSLPSSKASRKRLLQYDSTLLLQRTAQSSSAAAASPSTFDEMKEGTSHLKETYVMRLRMKEWVEGSAVDGGGAWQLFGGLVAPAEQSPSREVLPLNLA